RSRSPCSTISGRTSGSAASACWRCSRLAVERTSDPLEGAATAFRMRSGGKFGGGVPLVDEVFEIMICRSLHGQPSCQDSGNAVDLVQGPYRSKCRKFKISSSDRSPRRKCRGKCV